MPRRFIVGAGAGGIGLGSCTGVVGGVDDQLFEKRAAPANLRYTYEIAVTPAGLYRVSGTSGWPCRTTTVGELKSATNGYVVDKVEGFTIDKNDDVLRDLNAVCDTIIAYVRDESLQPWR
ncbi:MAG: hypothetical protein EOQ86_20860 [Mesorhizobium sp.]|uniref:hypothetical protein n=1 Tax=Mesorhizobium sp. TaxID=1871066 RepID=UPI000FEA3CB1|nr:hypothetical protein [Mesorhizobium sp.]RWH76497.1 MAG: hypothetical protein EOQ85_21290 [Mesorhizobium sp.]RWH79989.1 MAG: hypothetical protein EOQ86_20860 [Mesorhizobium sp.]RWH89145.1 MAG: hypothetical protein EOQ87_17795 [Mesorhizobium sp.]RWI01849.1 MAG: hypothetical protein EOQ88_05520 [Mesorhizobium sp.]RWI03389.1 MAG: hypothetical protein EOQ89_12280 [Mesorhizobium sp.]